MFFDEREDFRWARGFQQIIGGTAAQRVYCQRLLIESRKQNERHLRRDSLDCAEKLDTAHAGHIDVGKNQRRVVAFGSEIAKGSLTVREREAGIAVKRE